MIQTKETLSTLVYERLQDAYPVAPADIDFLYPPQVKMGDLALSLPLQMAKKLKANPRQIAQDIVGRLGGLPGIARLEVAGAGYVNLFLDRSAFFGSRLAALGTTTLRPTETKIVVEHTNINPNKAAHIGHLRNACLGDTLVRCLRARGENVEVQNYIDDTGVQVVDVVFGLLELERKSLADLESIERFDYYCWDLYARTTTYLEEHPESRLLKAEILKRIEHGADPEAAMARYVSRRILRAHLATMKRIGATYDVLPCESSILGLKFWDKAYAMLKDRQAIVYVDSGPNAGCWVMRLEDEEDKEKIIVRSDGTVTYVGKDIAYQLWKFGLLERDFYYEPFLEEDGRTLWISSAVPNDRKVGHGGASRVFNVIDTRQSYLQKVVTQGLRALGYVEQSAKSVHFSYEMVALSPRSLELLNYEASAEESAKGFAEVSGRKGLGVKADDLLDSLTEKAAAEVAKRHTDLPEASRSRIAAEIGRAALRYFMLKYARNSLIIFDIEDALSFEGETGPYLQYTAVRLDSIFRKLEEREGVAAKRLEAQAADFRRGFEALSEEESGGAWDVVSFGAKLDEEIVHSIESLEFSHLAKYAFQLCQKANGYYHKYPILAEPDPALRSARLMTVYYVRAVLGRALDLLGVPVPEKM
jgi:arginyl-tRNA synthetase